MDPEKLASIFADEEAMRRMVESINRIGLAIGVIGERAEGSGDAVKLALGKAEEAFFGVKSAAGEAKEVLADLYAESEASMSSLDKLFQRFGAGTMTARQGIEGLGKVMQQLGRDNDANSGFAGDALSKIPYVGPLLQMALDSEFREDKFRTAGRKAVLNMQRSDVLNPEQVKTTGAAIGADMKRLEESFLATRQEVQGVWQAYSEGGFKAVDMTKAVSFEVKGFGDTVATASLGLDKAFHLAAGSSAKFAETLTRSTNASLVDSVGLVKELGLAAHATGQSTEGFISTILQASSALRVQGGDARDLANTYFSLQGAIAKAMPTGTSAQRVSELTAGALSGLSSFAGNLPMGIKALVGQAIAKNDLGDSISDIEAIREMELGFHGKLGARGKDFSKTVAERTFQMFRGEGITSNSDMFMALTQAAGMTPQLADILVRNQGQLTGKGADEAAKAFQDQIKQAQDLQPLNVGEYERMMEELKQAMQAIGQATIQLLSYIATTLVSGFRYITQEGYSSEDFKSDTDKASARFYDSVVKASSKTGTVLGDVFGKAFEGDDSHEMRLARERHDWSAKFAADSARRKRVHDAEMAQGFQNYLAGGGENAPTQSKERKVTDFVNGGRSFRIISETTHRVVEQSKSVPPVDGIPVGH